MPQPSLSTYHPSLGERLQSGFANLLGKVGVDPRYANHVSQRALGFLNDLTPVGNATMAADAGTAIRNGHPLQGLGMGALAVLPGAAGKVGKKVARKVGRGMFGAAPIRAYHGGRAFEGDFDLAKAGTGLATPGERAVWFTPDREEAQRYAWSIEPTQTYDGKAIYPATIDSGDFHVVPPQQYDGMTFAQILEEARKAGKPGVIFKQVGEDLRPGIDQIAVLDPSRIKF